MSINPKALERTVLEHPVYGSKNRETQGYFITPKCYLIHFHVIGEEIQQRFPELIGAHIFKQLDALDLREVFDNSVTCCQLPWTFSSKEHVAWREAKCAEKDNSAAH